MIIYLEIIIFSTIYILNKIIKKNNQLVKLKKTFKSNNNNENSYNYNYNCY